MSRDRRAAVADCHGKIVVASSRVHVARVLGIGGGYRDPSKIDI